MRSVCICKICNMQNYLFDLNSKRPLCPNQLRTKLAVAAPTPNTIQRRHRVVHIPNIRTEWKWNERPNLLPVITLNGQSDGVYAINGVKSKKNVFKLLQFLKMAKDQYKLSDYDAICLLSFFKNNFLEARRHLYNDGTRSAMLLDIDVPWRLQLKSISELASIDYDAQYNIFRRLQKRSVNVKIETNILPQNALVQQFAGRYFRLQRTYYQENIIFVGCALPFNQQPFEIASLLLPFAVQRELNCYMKLMNHLEIYLAPIVLVSNIWSEHDQNRTKYISFDARVFEEGYLNQSSTPL